MRGLGLLGGALLLALFFFFAARLLVLELSPESLVQSALSVGVPLSSSSSSSSSPGSFLSSSFSSFAADSCPSLFFPPLWEVGSDDFPFAVALVAVRCDVTAVSRCVCSLRAPELSLSMTTLYTMPHRGSAFEFAEVAVCLITSGSHPLLCQTAKGNHSPLKSVLR